MNATNGITPPIFLTGVSRSGTTWVNNLFREYFDAGFVNEGQFIVSFGRRLASYGDLASQGNRERLISDLQRDPFFSILKANYAVVIDWTRAGRDGGAFAPLVQDILAQIAEQLGKSRIGSKYPAFGRHLALLDSLFPDCRVVHVVRDGRDCALSHRQVTWGRQNTYAAAVHWRDYLVKARAAAREMQGRYLEVRYEDLLGQPESTMLVLEAFITGASGPVTRRFMEDARLLDRKKIGAWRHEMGLREQAIFEGVAGDVLRESGYPLTGVAKPPTLLMRGVYAAHDRLTREAWHFARQVFPSIPERKR